MKFGLKQTVILGGAAAGGAFGWYYASPTSPGTSLILGILVGTWIASWVWEKLEE
jgi:hypothetical protein